MVHDIVSIIIPCFNCEACVRTAIESALKQNGIRCEVIVIDDGSTDRSWEVIQSFGDLIRCETGPNRGGCVARNRGLAIANGEWIQFLDADDFVGSEKIQTQLGGMRTSNSVLATCGWSYFESNGISEPSSRAFWKDYDQGIDLLRDMWKDGGFFNPACWLTHRSLIEKAGGWNEDLRADQDGEFFGRVLLEAEGVHFSAPVNAFYRKGNSASVSQSVSEVALRSRIEAARILTEKLQLKDASEKTLQACWYRWLGLAVFAAKHSQDLMEECLRHLEDLNYQPNRNELDRRGKFMHLVRYVGATRAVRLKSYFDRFHSLKHK